MLQHIPTLAATVRNMGIHIVCDEELIAHRARPPVPGPPLQQEDAEDQLDEHPLQHTPLSVGMAYARRALPHPDVTITHTPLGDPLLVHPKPFYLSAGSLETYYDREG